MLRNHTVKLVFTIIGSALLIASCTENPQADWEPKTIEIDRSVLLDISEFNIDSTALHEKERVKIICASESLFPTDQVDFYIHSVAVSMETGDTVNVLATGVLDVSAEDPYGEFISPNSDVGKILQNVNTIEDVVHIDDLTPSNFDKVYSDRNYINIKTSHFPTIIGMIGDDRSVK